MASKAIKPVYVLYGDDAYLLDQHRREIIARIIGQADPQICVGTFEPTAELAEVLDELRTLPLLAERRVVIVRDADAFVTAHRQALEGYFEAPSKTGSLMLTVSSWPSNTRLYKVVKKIGEAIDCSAAEGVDLLRWIREAASKRGKKIAPQAADLLAEWMGTDLAALDAEIEKLSLYVGGRQEIDVADISAIVTATAGPLAFALSNAITASDATAALEALDKMLIARGDEFKTLGMVAWHLRRALSAAQQIAADKTPSLRMPPQQRDAFLVMLKHRSVKKLQADFRKMIRTDLAMKSGVKPVAALQELVVSLCS
ncbi:MAG: DNA polymerase III subunit delta [Phycisphaerae bacterium]|nr:DNA polymerase III subunit delta [Phycisphaerae bacterium]